MDAAEGGLFCLEGYLDKGFNLGSFKEERIVFEKQMFPLLVRGRVYRSHSYPLCQDKAIMTSTIFSFWCVLDAFLFS